MQETQIASTVAYWGPAHSGKADVINRVYQSLPVEARHGPLIPSLPESGAPGHILFADLTPPWLSTVGGQQLTFRIATVPGLVFEDGARNELLRRADGFVIVLDPRPERFDATVEHAENLEFGLKEHGRPLSDHCFALQVHRAPDMPVHALRDAVETLLAQLPESMRGQRVHVADPRSGEGCDLAFRDVSQQKHTAISRLVERGILVPS